MTHKKFLVALGCIAAASATFASRVDYAPLVAKLRAAGGDPARVRVMTRAQDLDALEGGKRYKMVVRRDGRMAVAPLPADAPNNEYVHPILAGGEPVLTAGGVSIERGAEALAARLDQDSKSYCPTLASLEAAAAALRALGVLGPRIRFDDRPPACAPAR